jgi:hypothetical protein
VLCRRLSPWARGGLRCEERCNPPTSRSGTEFLRVGSSLSSLLSGQIVTTQGLSPLPWPDSLVLAFLMARISVAVRSNSARGK